MWWKHLLDVLAPNIQNQFLSGGLMLMLTAALLALCRRVPYQIGRWLQRRLTITVDVSSDDPLFAWLSLWLAAHPYSARARQLTATSERDEHGRSTPAPVSSDNSLPQVLFTPAPGNHLLLYRRRLVWLSRDRKEAAPGANDSFMSLWKREVFTLRLIGRNQEVARRLLEDARSLALSRRHRKVEIFIAGYDYWQSIDERDPRPLSSVFLPEGQVDDVVADVKKFLANQQWYADRGIPWRRGYLFHGTPGCHAKGSRILMYDGTLKNVEEIKIGDLLMGPDSCPREVLKLVRGEDEMFKVSPTKGEPFVVNRNHIFHLTFSGKAHAFGSMTFNIRLSQYLTLSKCMKERMKLTRSSGVDFPEQRLPIDPYILGLWLGDGTHCKPEITNTDPEVIDAWFAFCAERSLNVKRRGDITYEGRKSVDERKKGCNSILNDLRSLGVYKNKHIPHEYLTASRSQRLELLAGLVDSDGSLYYRTGIDFVNKNEAIATGFVYLCRSLGLAAYKKPAVKGVWVQNKKHYREGVYFRVQVSGNTNTIPTRILRKRASSRKQIKSVLRTGFKWKSLGMGEYFGFIVDGDHLYLTDDFTIHHNSGKTSLICALAGHFRMNLYILNLAGVHISDDNLMALLARLPLKSFLLLEDVDSAFIKRNKSDNVGNKLTFSGLLNALDGAGSKDGTIAFMTTNHIENLDDALIRPGRADKKIQFGYATKDQASNMFQAFFPGSIQMDAFGELVAAQRMTMADIQQHLITHQNSPVEALAALPVIQEAKHVGAIT